MCSYVALIPHCLVIVVRSAMLSLRSMICAACLAVWLVNPAIATAAGAFHLPAAGPLHFLPGSMPQVAAEFLKLRLQDEGEDRGQRWVVIDASQDVEAVHKRVRAWPAGAGSALSHPSAGQTAC